MRNLARVATIAVGVLTGCVGDSVEVMNNQLQPVSSQPDASASEPVAAIGTEPDAVSILRDFRSRFTPSTSDAERRLGRIRTNPLASSGRLRAGSGAKIDQIKPEPGVEIHADLADGFELRSQGMIAVVKLDGSLPGRAHIVDGVAVYPAALPGGHVLYNSQKDVIEDFVVLRNSRQNAVEYLVGINDAVKGVRLMGNSVEFLDAVGVPQIRMAPPVIIDSTGAVEAADVDVTDCDINTNPEPFIPPAIVPGSDHCRVTITWDASRLQYPVAVDPSWVYTATGMMVKRAYHSSSPSLNSGQVLVAGGWNEVAGLLSSTEWYFSGSFSTGPQMKRTRSDFTLTLLPTGEFLAAGGYSYSANTDLTTEMLSGGVWQYQSNLNWRAIGHTATYVPSTGQIVILGGYMNYDGTWGPSAACQYRTTGGVWTGCGCGMAYRRAYHSATLTTGNRLVVAAGNGLLWNGTGSPVDLGTTEYFDVSVSAIGCAQAAGTIPARSGHFAGVVGSGVLVAGGTASNDAYLYNQSSNAWSAVAGTITARGFGATATTNSGHLYLIGGTNGSTTSQVVDAFDVYTPSAPWHLVNQLNVPRQYLAASVINDGTSKILVTGGKNGSNAVQTAELLDLSILGTGCSYNTDCRSGFCADSVCCNSLCGASCDACNLSGTVGSCGSVPAGTVPNPSCSGFLCNGSNAACPATCSADSQCAMGYYCSDGSPRVCRAKEAVGVACTRNEVCANSRCIDGFCCDSPCGGECDVCSATLGASANGTCTKISGPGSPTCAPQGYVCRGTTSGCPNTCSTDDHCALGFACVGGTCSRRACSTSATCPSGYYCAVDGYCRKKLADGTASSNPSLCEHGYVVNGFCCNSQCANVCGRCDLLNSEGQCTAVPVGTAPSGTGCNGFACGGGLDCTPSPQCPTTPCLPTHYCTASHTCAPKVISGSCSSDDQCSSGFCVGGICCSSRCDGECRTCTAAGSSGTCTTITIGASCSSLLSDPAATASANYSTTEPSSVFENAQFLYSGAAPTQLNAPTLQLSRERAAILRGRVMTTSGVALANVEVRIRNRPEYGYTRSRADGMW